MYPDRSVGRAERARCEVGPVEFDAARVREVPGSKLAPSSSSSAPCGLLMSPTWMSAVARRNPSAKETDPQQFLYTAGISSGFATSSEVAGVVSAISASGGGCRLR